MSQKPRSQMPFSMVKLDLELVRFVTIQFVGFDLPDDPGLKPSKLFNRVHDNNSSRSLLHRSANSQFSYSFIQGPPLVKWIIRASSAGHWFSSPIKRFHFLGISPILSSVVQLKRCNHNPGWVFTASGVRL